MLTDFFLVQLCLLSLLLSLPIPLPLSLPLSRPPLRPARLLPVPFLGYTLSSLPLGSSLPSLLCPTVRDLMQKSLRLGQGP